MKSTCARHLVFIVASLVLFFASTASASCVGLSGGDLEKCRKAEGEMLAQYRERARALKDWKEKNKCKDTSGDLKTKCMSEALSKEDALEFERSGEGEKFQ